MKFILAIIALLCVADTSLAQDYINGPAWGPSFRQIDATRRAFPSPWPQETNPYRSTYPSNYWTRGNGLHRGSYGIVFDARTGQFLQPQPHYRYVRPVQPRRYCFWIYR